MRIRIILQTQWILSHTRALPLFTMDLAARGYVRVAPRLVGWGYRRILVTSERGIEKSYRDPPDHERYLRYFSREVGAKERTLQRSSSESARKTRAALRALKKVRERAAPEELVQLVASVADAYADLAAILSVTGPGPSDAYASRYGRMPFTRTLTTIRQVHGALYPQLERQLHNLYAILSRRWRLPIRLLPYLTAGEMLLHLRRGTRPSMGTLRARFERYVLYATAKNVDLLTGRRAQRIITALARQEDAAPTHVVRGSAAFLGKVCGRVRIVYSENDAEKLRRGEVIVTPMTQVSFVPFLQRAVGIVTNEGGITCHAAIIARELKKPCIIGTKIATKVLKDGDLVEVDAEKGIVWILKRGSSAVLSGESSGDTVRP